jgi:hypothetical protein
MNAAPKSREAFLTAPVTELTAYWLGVSCTTNCNRTSYIPLKLLAAKRPGRLKLAAVVERLRCEHCKTPPSAVWITDYPIAHGEHGGHAATWSVTLAP